MRFWSNVSLHSIILQMLNQGESRPSVLSKISALCLLCVSLSSFFFSITRVHINFALTLHPICSIICWTVTHCQFRATGNSLFFHTSLGSLGKLSLIDAISSFGPNDKITEKFSPTLHHTWEKSALFCLPTTTKTWLTRTQRPVFGCHCLLRVVPWLAEGQNWKCHLFPPLLLGKRINMLAHIAVHCK